MAKIQLKKDITDFSKNLSDSNLPKANKDSIATRSLEAKDRINSFLKKRDKQRDDLFSLATGWTSAWMFILIIFLVAQFSIRLLVDPNFEIVNSGVLKALIIAVIGQFVGVIGIMVASLWNSNLERDMLKD